MKQLKPSSILPLIVRDRNRNAGGRQCLRKKKVLVSNWIKQLRVMNFHSHYVTKARKKHGIWVLQEHPSKCSTNIYCLNILLSSILPTAVGYLFFSTILRKGAQFCIGVITEKIKHHTDISYLFLLSDVTVGQTRRKLCFSWSEIRATVPRKRGWFYWQWWRGILALSLTQTFFSWQTSSKGRLNTLFYWLHEYYKP